MPSRLTIGEFSRMTHLSVRTLRRYHDAGLLEPTAIEVERRHVPRQTVAGISETVGRNDVLAWYDEAVSELGAWADGSGLAIDGPVCETYLVGPHDNADESAWRTEIGWPVSIQPAISPRSVSARSD